MVFVWYLWLHEYDICLCQIWSEAMCKCRTGPWQLSFVHSFLQMIELEGKRGAGCVENGKYSQNYHFRFFYRICYISGFSDEKNHLTWSSDLVRKDFHIVSDQKVPRHSYLTQSSGPELPWTHTFPIFFIFKLLVGRIDQWSETILVSLARFKTTTNGDEWKHKSYILSNEAGKSLCPWQGLPA